MTNYRLTINKENENLFNFCFTCGAKLKKEDEILTCSKSWVHIRVFLEDMEEDDYKETLE